MNELLKYFFLNIGKSIGILAGFIIAFFLLFFGLLKTLFISAFVLLGFILGKWYDEGISFKRFIKNLASSLRLDKWR